VSLKSPDRIERTMKTAREQAIAFLGHFPDSAERLTDALEEAFAAHAVAQRVLCSVGVWLAMDVEESGARLILKVSDAVQNAPAPGEAA
jgi:hypothetical protein